MLYLLSLLPDYLHDKPIKWHIFFNLHCKGEEWAKVLAMERSHRAARQIAHPQADQLTHAAWGGVLLWRLQICFTLTPLEKAVCQHEQCRPERWTLRCLAHMGSAIALQKIWCDTKQCKCNKLKGMWGNASE